MSSGKQLFNYKLEIIDSISEDDDLQIGFDDFLNRGNEKNNNINSKRKPTHTKEKGIKKPKYSFSEEEDELVVTPSENKKPIKIPEISLSVHNRPLPIKDPSFLDSLDKTKRLKGLVAQSQSNCKVTSIDLQHDEEARNPNSVKLLVHYPEKNRVLTFAVKMMESFELLAAIVSDILSIPKEQIQFKLYSQVIDLKKCPNDYGLEDGEKLTMALQLPFSNPKVATTIVIEEKEEKEDEQDEFKKKLEALVNSCGNTSAKLADKENIGPKKISVHVALPGQTKHKKYKILPTDPFEKIILAIFNDTKKKITLEFEGEIIDPEDCPVDYDMEGGEQIDGKYDL